MTGGTGAYVYMAPEVFRHEPYNTKADVYSLAVVLYQMLSGRRPFGQLDPSTAAMRAATDDLRPEWPKSPPVQYVQSEQTVLAHTQALTERCWTGCPSQRCALRRARSVLHSALTTCMAVGMPGLRTCASCSNEMGSAGQLRELRESHA